MSAVGRMLLLGIASLRGYRSSGLSPAFFATRAKHFGPISSLSWKANTTSGQPGRVRVFVRTGLPLDAPPDAEQRREDALGFCGRPLAHAAAKEMFMNS